MTTLIIVFFSLSFQNHLYVYLYADHVLSPISSQPIPPALSQVPALVLPLLKLRLSYKLHPPGHGPTEHAQ